MALVKKYIAIGTCSLLMSCSISAIGQTEQPRIEQQVESPQNKVESAAKLALQKRLTALQSFSAQFSQQVADAEGELLQEAEGKILLQQPDKLYWQVFEPNENLMLADGNTLWHIDPFAEQVIAMNQQQAVADNPMVLLTNPDTQAWSGFDVEQEGDDFTIVAKNGQSQIVALKLMFKDDQLQGLALIDRQEQISRLTFSSPEQNSDIAAETFVFTMPEGYDLDDQRQP